ncbi:LpxL/LpxP family Kdo(2)-lipid IV(A) lauroyl/palmitoleoyl acyltransferase [Vibrio sp. SS-MA-C1-2]|uniref:LpxL/LpxP family Kdo(2)-lipid IV(A) lauroyl/palmitoleoyl acyltransferase n=1 Tax=Vibrio sp. SS-MA-C1-2 TaxID=2908646 RepID=UPI001F24E2A9|nr:LpxL/LpxP family Kdo(2)-lipid IV(A) lauroyl/palmitoleoyl acyltransferase [Vibrio sp. SS-MA-C1-2]UJF19106.1 LpxL/LpxP family Kdo(2)-lipid IV(A) lauroyl/palmitoleoyl acyltransferase [Vibrio sp. SS-MA-C1-2]
MSQIEPPKFSYSFFHPKYLPIWLGAGFMFLVSLLPYRFQYHLGRQLGKVMMKLMPRRVAIARTNLELCFPEMAEQEKEKMVKDNFSSLGLGLFETAMAWFWPDWRVENNVTYKGLEHIKALQDEGKGVLLIAIHSLNLEFGARAFGIKNPGVGVYRANKNPLYDWIQFSGRVRSNKYMLDRKDVKGMLRGLRKGDILWYAPDHDYGPRRSTFAPLFAVEKACTTTGTSLLANASRCALVPFTIVRNPDGQGYTMEIEPPLDKLPRHDDTLAATQVNQAIERSILRAPEQYMWLHRRFKTRPEGEEHSYPKKKKDKKKAKKKSI